MGVDLIFWFACYGGEVFVAYVQMNLPRLLDESLVSPDSHWPLVSTGLVRFSGSSLSCSHGISIEEIGLVTCVLLTSYFCSSQISASRDSCLRTSARFSSLNSPTSSLSRSFVCALASHCSCACAFSTSYSWRRLITDPFFRQCVHTYNSALLQHVINAS